jgi:hypothetical protein
MTGASAIRPTLPPIRDPQGAAVVDQVVDVGVEGLGNPAAR